MKVFLVGFMGCGKSTIGKKLAKKMNLPFIDSDSVIEENEGKSVEEIFSSNGEDYFRLLETKFLEDLKDTSAVISLGGGTPCEASRLELIKKKGELIYIDLPAQALLDRLIHSKKPRPLIDHLKDNPDQLLEYIKMKLEERKPFYEEASMTISGINLSSERLDLIVQLLKH